MNNQRYDVIIVGAGPAGMTAALYARRNDKSVLILEKENFGGQISFAPKVENFPTIKSCSGREIADKLFDQILELGVEFELEKVEKVEKVDGVFQITTDYRMYESRSVIIATGAKHRKLGLTEEQTFLGKGVSYCAVCDGAFYKDEEVAVIGDGNSALQYALQLSGYCPRVYVCTLFDHFFGDQVLVNQLKEKKNIQVVPHISLKKMKGKTQLEELVFENTIHHQEFLLKVKGAFIAIGQVPYNEIIKNLAQLDKEGYALVDETLETKTKGLFVAGDCRTKKVRQMTTAVSDGAIAALAAVQYLNQE